MFMKTDYPSVLLIYTGGTIGMIENPETGALENFNFDHLLKHVPELKRFNYRISSYQFDPPIDSSDMEPSLWAKIVKIINYNYDYFDGLSFFMEPTPCLIQPLLSVSCLRIWLSPSFSPALSSLSALCVQMERNLITSIEIAAAKNPDGTPIVPEVCIFLK